jgi:hypothetical protein
LTKLAAASLSVIADGNRLAFQWLCLECRHLVGKLVTRPQRDPALEELSP